MVQEDRKKLILPLILVILFTVLTLTLVIKKPNENYKVDESKSGEAIKVKEEVKSKSVKAPKMSNKGKIVNYKNEGVQ